MNIRKAVITAAGPTQRALPLQVFVDRDGVEKTALQIILEEVFAAGVEDACLVIMPGDEAAYRAAAGPHASRVLFVEQREPQGYGHALALAADFIGKDAFLHLVSDHLYISAVAARCAAQVVEAARTHGCSVSAVQATREHMLPYYGTVGGRRVSNHRDLYEIETVLEKPTPSQAEQTLYVPGLRAGHYLCYFGIHVFAPTVMELLQMASQSGARTWQLTPVLADLARRERYLALELRGRRFNIGVKYGLLIAQLALCLDGIDRGEILTQLVDLLALNARRDRDSQ
jgi:UTP--glucose-1-phosphate uridylyltransferase